MFVVNDKKYRITVLPRTCFYRFTWKKKKTNKKRQTKINNLHESLWLHFYSCAICKKRIHLINSLASAYVRVDWILRMNKDFIKLTWNRTHKLKTELILINISSVYINSELQEIDGTAINANVKWEKDRMRKKRMHKRSCIKCVLAVVGKGGEEMIEAKKTARQ